MRPRELWRQRGYEGPVIALTAHAMAEDRQRCLASGCSEYASKPINRRELIETIRAPGGGNPLIRRRILVYCAQKTH